VSGVSTGSTTGEGGSTGAAGVSTGSTDGTGGSTDGTGGSPRVEGDSTGVFQEAVAQAEGMVRGAPFVRTEQDLAEGLDYLAGSIRASLQMAWSYRPDQPYFVNSTNQHTKMGLDNPDTVYYHANLRPDTTYHLRGRRGTTVDLSFQVLGGDYTPSSTPEGSTAFDDRELNLADDGSFELSFGPAGSPYALEHHVALPETAAMLAVREVYDDWSAQRGSLAIQRADTVGVAPPRLDGTAWQAAVDKRYAVAAKMLTARIKTWFAFPEWFYLNEPVNTFTEPRPTPGGLASQWSSVGHYALPDDQVMVVTVPRGKAPYLGFQLGTVWYTSLEYADHQTSLNGHQAQVDPDGMIRLVIAEHDPGVANWIERLGHDRGYLQFRWQRLSGELTPTDGPSWEVVTLDRLPQALPYHDDNRIDPESWRERIAARQSGVAARMLS
jgi:hypothetical protein